MPEEAERKQFKMEMRELILKALEKNSRMDIHELAIMLGCQEVDVMNEIAAMEKEKIICGYHTLINWDKVGQERLKALIEVKVAPQRGTGFEKVAERIYRYPEVDDVYLISGAYDILVIMEGKTMREVSQFVYDKLASIDAVYSTATHFILRKYKDHGTILIETPKAERQMITP